MIALRIEGATRVLGRSQGYIGLPVLDRVGGDGQAEMVSRWSLTPREMEAVGSSGAIELRVMGQQHPPVWLGVAPMPAVRGDPVAKAYAALVRIASLPPEASFEVIRGIAVEAMRGAALGVANQLPAWVGERPGGGVYFATLAATEEECRGRIATEALLGVQVRPRQCRVEIID